MIRILVVDDNAYTQRFCKESLGELEVVPATTIEEARQAFTDNPDFAAIVMDACVPGYAINTLPLVKEFRQTFRGPMIASSTEERYRIELMAAGCDYETYKEEIHHTVRKVLGLKQPPYKSA